MNTDNIRIPRGVLFDLGDTVIQLESQDNLEGNRHMLEYADINPGITAEDALAIIAKIFSWYDSVRDKSMQETSFTSINRLVYDTLGITFSISYDELEKVFWEGSLSYAPVEGIFELLDVLDTGGIKTGIISNSIFSANILEDELKKNNLDHRFSFLISSADYGIRKPHPYIFRVAVQKLGLAPRDIWFIGDIMEYDVRGALNAGLYPVWLNRRKEKATIDGDYLEVSDLHQLRGKIEHSL
jgi:putative hydrolase of the HAD superfamily